MSEKSQSNDSLTLFLPEPDKFGNYKLKNGSFIYSSKSLKTTKDEEKVVVFNNKYFVSFSHDGTKENSDLLMDADSIRYFKTPQEALDYIIAIKGVGDE